MLADIFTKALPCGSFVTFCGIYLGTTSSGSVKYWHQVGADLGDHYVMFYLSLLKHVCISPII